MKKWLIFLVLVLSACTTTHQTHEQAKTVFDKALTAYQTQNYTTALPLFYQASELGFFKADRYIGLAYLNGYGVEKNPKKAFEAFSKASDKDITSQYWLGYLYENGIGTEKDLKQAIYWYQKSAQRGDHVSQPAIDALKRLNL